MKKLWIFILVAFIVFGTLGMASAVDYRVRLLGTHNFFASPVTDAGTSVYFFSGGAPDFLGAQTAGGGGVSFYAVDPTSESGTTTFNLFSSGSSCYGTPVCQSGETVFVIVQDSFGAETVVGGVTSFSTGVSLFAISGKDGSSVSLDIPAEMASNHPGSAALIPEFIAPSGIIYSAVSGFQAASLLLDPDGVTIYGTSGVSVQSGASIWAINKDVTPLALNSNIWGSVWAAGASEFISSPLISGNSLFVLAQNYWNDAGSGVSLLAFDKAKLNAGYGTNWANVWGPSLGAGLTTPLFPTPCIAGNSIYVCDARGAVTDFKLTDFTKTSMYQFGTETSSVTASPVTNGDYLVVSANYTTGVAGITVFKLDGGNLGAGVTPWFYEWTDAGGVTITATPAISDGELFVIVNKGNQGAVIDTFTLNAHDRAGKLAAPDKAAISTDATGVNFGFCEYASPLIKNGRLIFISDSAKTLYNVDVGADGEAYWRQFKADAVRTGENTKVPEEAAVVPGSSGGCFISTIQ